jgi:hypothetical protein
MYYSSNNLMRRAIAEFFGTMWLTFGGCGAAVSAAAYPELGIGFVGVAFAFGLTVLTMAYAVGHISGGHFNPAVTLGLWSAGRCPSITRAVERIHNRVSTGRISRKQSGRPLHHLSGDWGDRGCGRALGHRFRQGRLGAT